MLLQSTKIILISLLTIPVLSLIPVEAKTLYIFLNPHRHTLIEQDAQSIVQEIVQSKKGDKIVCLDIYNHEIFQWHKTNGSKLTTKRQQNQIVRRIKQYCQNAIKKYPHQNHLNMPEILGRISHRIRFTDPANLYVILFHGGLHANGTINFQGKYPSDSFATHSHSAFSAVDKMSGGYWILVADPTEFSGLKHQQKLRQFYSRYINQLGATLVGYGTMHTQIRDIIHKKITTPIISNLQLDTSNDELILYEIGDTLQDASENYRIELKWDTVDQDLDLYVGVDTPPNLGFLSYKNRTSHENRWWKSEGIEAVDLFQEHPKEIWVHYYSGTGTSTAQVSIYQGTQLKKIQDIYFDTETGNKYAERSIQNKNWQKFEFPQNRSTQ